MRRRPAAAEHGMSVSMAVLALTIISMIMLYVGTQTMNSLLTSRTKQERTVGMAAGDSGIEKYRVALQHRLADESTRFQLDGDSLRLLVKEQQGAKVIDNSKLPASWGLQPALVPAASQFTVKEPSANTYSYWQVFHVVPPRYDDRAGRAHDLVVYIRAWATSKSDQVLLTTKPRIFRVEYRPGFFSDYFSVTDAPFFVKDNPNYAINGPVHSNGYTVVDWLAKTDSFNTASPTLQGIWFNQQATCRPGARFSISQGTTPTRGIAVPGPSCKKHVDDARTNARQVNLLGVEDSYRYMEARCGAGVYCPNGAGPFAVTLGTNSVTVDNQTIPLGDARWIEGPDSYTLSILVSGDVTLRGQIRVAPGGVVKDKVARVTIANRRVNPEDEPPHVFLEAGGPGAVIGAVRPPAKSDASTGEAVTFDAVGIITQGNVVLGVPPASNCIGEVNVAAISQTGSVTIPAEFVTIAPPAISFQGRSCGEGTSLLGSFSAHGQFIASIVWPDVMNPGGELGPVGYERPELSYNRNLFVNPPPYFPTATPWAVTKVKDADTRCLVGTTAEDPTCE